MAIRYLSGVNIDSNTLFVNDSTNRVGIGTATPDRTLSVHSAASSVMADFKYTAGGFSSIILSNTLGSAHLASVVNDLLISPAGTERMRVTNAGNVGIGTTSPAQKLHLYGGNISIDNSSDVALIFAKSGASKYEWYLDNATNNFGLYDRGNSAWRFNVTNSGNVGIGTTNPESYYSDKLVVNAGNEDGITIVGGTSDINYLMFADGTVGSARYRGMVWYNHSLDMMAFSTSGNNRVYIDATGNVGIGTASPADKLHVKGGFRVEDASSGNNFRIGFADPNTVDLVIEPSDDVTPNVFRFRPNSQNAGAGLRVLDRYEADYISLRHDGAVGVIETDSDGGNIYISPQGSVAITATTSGNVGIGTTSPGAKLHIYSASSGSTMVVGRAAGYSSIKASADADGGYLSLDSNGSATIINHYVSDDVWLVTGGGRVGIGTSSANRTLTVNGVVGIASGSTNVPELVLSADASATYISSTYKGTSSYVPLWFETNGSPRMAITTGGNVGIGTTSPSYKLDVTGDINFTDTLKFGGVDIIHGTSADVYANVRVIRNASTSVSDGMYIGYNNSGGASGHLRFYANGTSERMRINASTGYVGIGTASPGSKLDIGNNTSETIRISAVATSGSTANLLFGSNAIVSQAAKIQGIYGASYDGALAFYTQDAGASDGNRMTEKVRILSSGNVGIGTTTPATKLQVDASGHALVVSNDTGNRRIYFGTGTLGEPDIQATLSNGTARELSINAAGGNVGIGVVGPSQKLHVSGNVRVTGAYYDSNNEAGTSGQVLSSTGSGTDWVSLSEITGVDGTGTANYIAKWSDADTITDSTITDDGTTVTAGVERFKILYQAGIYSFSDTVDASTSEDIFSISNTNGAQAFRVTFVCSTSAFSVAKTYEVVHSYGNTPVAFKVVDSGPYSGNDFDVAFTNAVTDTGIKCAITNNSTTVNANIVTTIFLGGSPTTITVTEH